MMPRYICHADHLPRTSRRYVWADDPSDAVIAYLGNRLRSLSLQPKSIKGHWVYLALVKRGKTAKQGERTVCVRVVEITR